ncbi:hypothetical protein RRG08_066232 [Elysia crispata]|uniref:Uncharacterized protein n=1 Tax=Elysia crispata TaxID=231223 RepID=A0AAE1BEH3_9GAST|nr:hypothetical protein RRG08_066232 [Elysia crispata]
MGGVACQHATTRPCFSPSARLPRLITHPRHSTGKAVALTHRVRRVGCLAPLGIAVLSLPSRTEKILSFCTAETDSPSGSILSFDDYVENGFYCDLWEIDL